MHHSSLTLLQCSKGPVQLRLLPGGVPGEVAYKVGGACGPAARSTIETSGRHSLHMKCTHSSVLCLVMGSELQYAYGTGHTCMHSSARQFCPTVGTHCTGDVHILVYCIICLVMNGK